MGFLSDVFSGVGDVIGDVVGGITGATQAAESAEKAGEIQSEAAMAGIEEQRRQFDIAMSRLSPYQQAGVAGMEQLVPYIGAGRPAIEAQQDLAGLRGPEAQRAAIDRLAASPEFQAQVEQGERALLQRASATGGLRGGNVQEALAQFRPQMLSNLINQQYKRLGGFTQLGSQTATNLAQIGQSAAAGQATGALQTGQQIAGLLGEAGAARAGGELAMGGVPRQAFSDLMNIGGLTVGAVSGGLF